jgi:hypothetical protein
MLVTMRMREEEWSRALMVRLLRVVETGVREGVLGASGLVRGQRRRWGDLSVRSMMKVLTITWCDPPPLPPPPRRPSFSAHAVMSVAHVYVINVCCLPLLTVVLCCVALYECSLSLLFVRSGIRRRDLIGKANLIASH